MDNAEASTPLPFQLLKLPAVALNQVVRMMHGSEIMKLSMCSHRLELFMKLWKYKLKRLEVHLKHESLNFKLTKACIVFRDRELKPHLEPVTKMSQLCGRLKENVCSTELVLFFSRETMFDLYYLVMSLFAPAAIQWVLNIEELPRETLLRYLDKGLSENCSEISIENGNLSIERLTELMDRIPVTKGLKVTSWIPSKFKHPNAFKYRTIWYEVAHWVTLDDLKSIRNADSVVLKWTSFDSKDLNEFLRYWVDCEEEMMKQLMFGIHKVIDKNILTDQLLVLGAKDGLLPHYHLKKINHKTGKIVVGRVEISYGIFMQLRTYDIDHCPRSLAILEEMEKEAALKK
ncbi:hypothetical protein GCK72_016592 [Caenorhabditis remanei]|uniref:F-box domain-containing protein n=1 Tax=Caenorhabditis remanei TaxID=31234 RepID=A0A6A5G528_CAERE|nr:hypothetical protein GCK72_016592 [Caenorhabditis remanei]KAF1750047.1 hypothetical protein GCK72_016592 [Caenorhabditis remanei]